MVMPLDSLFLSQLDPASLRHPRASGDLRFGLVKQGFPLARE